LVVACAGDASDAAASAQQSARSWTDLAKDKLNLFSKDSAETGESAKGATAEAANARVARPTRARTPPPTPPQFTGRL